MKNQTIEEFLIYKDVYFYNKQYYHIIMFNSESFYIQESSADLYRFAPLKNIIKDIKNNKNNKELLNNMKNLSNQTIEEFLIGKTFTDRENFYYLIYEKKYIGKGIFRTYFRFNGIPSALNYNQNWDIKDIIKTIKLVHHELNDKLLNELIELFPEYII